MDQAFEELKDISESELDVVYEKIEELESRMNKYGLL